MTFERVKFNWNVVAKLDPDYIKYLVDINKVTKTPERPQARIMHEPVIADMDDFRLKGRTEEELEIIQMLHGTNVETESDPVFDHRVESNNPKPKEISAYYMLEPGHDKAPPLGSYNPLELLPPKTVLDLGSTIHYSPDLCYSVSNNWRNDNFRRLSKTKISRDGKMLRLVRAAYFFFPEKNTMTDVTSSFGCITYNRETKMLYCISNYCKNPSVPIKTMKRYGKKVRRVGLNFNLLAANLQGNNTRIAKQFILYLRDVVKEDVPDLFLPNISDIRTSIDCTYSILLLTLQHRLGQRVDWLDKNLVSQLAHPMFNDAHAFRWHIDEENENQTIEEANNSRNKAVNKWRRQRTKIIPNLKKHNNYTCFVQSLFGDYYHKVLLKLFPQCQDPHHLILILKALHRKEGMPKFIYHWLVEVLNMEPARHGLMGGIAWALEDLMNADNPAKMSRIIKLYIKTCRRHLYTTDMEPAGWHTWRDMYRMAEQLNFRIRPNKFDTPLDIRDLHDKLSDLQHRDFMVMLDYKGEEFLHFEHPDKEYGNGFKFVWLGTPEDLVHEGRMMHHCVGGYSDYCLKGRSIIFSMRKGDRGYITIELDGRDYRIRQQYTIKDFTVRNTEMLDVIEEWHNDILEMHQDEESSYVDKCQVNVARFKLKSEIKSLEKQLSSMWSANLTDLRSVVEMKLTAAKKKLEELENDGGIPDEESVKEYDTDLEEELLAMDLNYAMRA